MATLGLDCWSSLAPQRCPSSATHSISQHLTTGKLNNGGCDHQQDLPPFDPLERRLLVQTDIRSMLRGHPTFAYWRMLKHLALWDCLEDPYLGSGLASCAFPSQSVGKHQPQPQPQPLSRHYFPYIPLGLSQVSGPRFCSKKEMTVS